MKLKKVYKKLWGGNAILVKDGKTYQTPNVGANREPRTAVGIKKRWYYIFL